MPTCLRCAFLFYRTKRNFFHVNDFSVSPRDAQTAGREGSTWAPDRRVSSRPPVWCRPIARRVYSKAHPGGAVLGEDDTFSKGGHFAFV